MNGAFSRILVAIKVLGQMFFLFGLLSWLDGVIVQFTHPEWLPLSVSHLLPWIRTDTFTILSFIASMVGFFVWRIIVEITRLDQKNSVPS